MVFKFKTHGKWIIGGMFLLLLCCLSLWVIYPLLRTDVFNTDKREYIYITPDNTVDDILMQIKPYLHTGSLWGFKFLYKAFGLNDHIPVGAYTIKSGDSMLNLLKRIRRREQTPVLFTFNNIRNLQEFSNRADNALLLSQDSLLAALKDSLITAKYGFSPETIATMFIPNSYEIYWNTGVNNFLGRMKREYDSFWNQERKDKAKKQGLSPIEVSILASIVEEESKVAYEYPIIAGLYLNRLRKGMLLQADPTVKFAIGDFSLKRILNEHLTVDSPYNTYLHTGLPPGPIRIPSVAAIDGVLNASDHSFLYMCAKEDFSGTHNFAKSLREHNRNADKYRNALNKLKIR